MNEFGVFAVSTVDEALGPLRGRAASGSSSGRYPTARFVLPMTVPG